MKSRESQTILASIIKRADRKRVREVKLQLAELAWQQRTESRLSQGARSAYSLSKQIERQQLFINHLKVYADLEILDRRCSPAFQFDITAFEQLLIQKMLLFTQNIITGNQDAQLELRLMENDLELSFMIRKINFNSYCQPYHHDLNEIMQAKTRLAAKMHDNQLYLLQKNLEQKAITLKQMQEARLNLNREITLLLQKKEQLESENQQESNHQISLRVQKEQPKREAQIIDLDELLSSLHVLYAARKAQRKRLQSYYNTLRQFKI